MGFDYSWTLDQLPEEKNGRKVFSCFSCGGGSSMGYKRAGFDVIGNCEIDKKINAMYVKNMHPKYNYCMDLREFNAIPDADLPEELFGIDILDGSPPPVLHFRRQESGTKDGEKKRYLERVRQSRRLMTSFLSSWRLSENLIPRS